MSSEFILATIRTSLKLIISISFFLILFVCYYCCMLLCILSHNIVNPFVFMLTVHSFLYSFGPLIFFIITIVVCMESNLVIAILLQLYLLWVNRFVRLLTLVAVIIAVRSTVQKPRASIKLRVAVVAANVVVCCVQQRIGGGNGTVDNKDFGVAAKVTKFAVSGARENLVAVATKELDSLTVLTTQ